jgi:hypothetical protein
MSERIGFMVMQCIGEIVPLNCRGHKLNRLLQFV